MLVDIKKRLGPRVSSWVPLNLWHRLVELDLMLPYYHMVSDQELPHVSGLFKFRSVRQFKADMEFFLRFYTPVSLDDVIRHLDGGSRLPKRSFLLTFDDGFREVYDVVAPILLARGIPAVFFLTTSTIDNRELCDQQKMSLLIHALSSRGDFAMTQEATQLLAHAGVTGATLLECIRNITYHQRYVLDQLGSLAGCNFAAYAGSVQPYLTSVQIKRLMRQGFTIGAHSVDHPLYSTLSLEEQLAQTYESLDWLSDHFQFKCQSFAFPFNDTGISREFFEETFTNGRVKISFGTGGMHRHFFSRHFNRYTMEFPELGTAQILGREFAVNFLRKPRHK